MWLFIWHLEATGYSEIEKPQKICSNSKSMSLIVRLFFSGHAFHIVYPWNIISHSSDVLAWWHLFNWQPTSDFLYPYQMKEFWIDKSQIAE